VLLWDGGNNDFSFYRPTVSIVVADPLRPGHETSYHPGEANLRMANAVVINKIDSAEPKDVSKLEKTIAELNPGATIVKANSKVTLEAAGDGASDLKGKNVLVIEDGPTLTHGEMKFGAGVVAAKRGGAAQIVDPRQYATGTLKATYEKYDVGPVLPAMGYAAVQLEEMKQIIDAAPVDVVVIASPIDLRHLIQIDKPAVRVGYELEELPGSPTIRDVLAPVLPSK
jgi:predicted GTPase